MKRLKNISLIAGSVLLIYAVPANNKYLLSDDYIISISGTSNLHNWIEKVETATGNCDASINSDNSLTIEAIIIKMEVRSIKSDKGSVMNNKTYKSLKAETFPQIIFVLDQPVKSIQPESTNKKVFAKGFLTIAGITNSIEVNVVVSMKDDKTISVEGIQKINMTDYGIIPPTALLGRLKTGNEIMLNFKTNFIKI